MGRSPADRRRRRTTLLAVLAVGIPAACGTVEDSGRVAFTQVEIQAFLEREVARTLPGVAVGAASCPAELPGRTGETATCAVTVDGGILSYEVQRLVAGRFEARPQPPVVLVRDIAAAVRSKLATPAAQVSCGAAAVVQPAPGEPLLCQITGTGEPRTASVQVSPDGTIVVAEP